MYTLTITCPRPRNRAGDDFHLRPERLAQMAAEWFGPDAALEVTMQSVCLRTVGPGTLDDIAYWHRRLAAVLNCLLLDVPSAGVHYALPRPIRTEISQT